MSVRPGRQQPLAFHLTPPPERIAEAFQRLSREHALHSLVRWALPVSMLRGILKEAMPRHLVQEMPPEAWGGLAVSLALDIPLFRDVLAVALHERLAWDREPSALEEYDRLSRERPLEALWMAALSEAKPVRKAFPRLAGQCLRSYRTSPTCTPPSWDYVEALHQLQGQALRDLEKTEKAAEAAARDLESERVHVADLREEHELSTDPWLTRKRDTVAKLTAGSPISLAEIVRDGAQRERALKARKKPAQLSPGEKELYLRAWQLLADEIARARDFGQAEAEAWINDQLGRSATATASS